jgi:hypothetical protein
MTSTYTANWRWDLALYMAFAEIIVYAEGTKVGSAVYDSLHGGANMNKFINAEAKIRELVDELFRDFAPTTSGSYSNARSQSFNPHPLSAPLGSPVSTCECAEGYRSLEA